MNSSSYGKDIIWRHCRHWLMEFFAPGRLLQHKYLAFREVLRLDSLALNLLTELESHLFGRDPADPSRINFLCKQVTETVGSMAINLQEMSPAYHLLIEQHARLSTDIKALTSLAETNSRPPYVLPMAQAADHPELAGGKAANLSSAGRAGVAIPQGFVVTANAFHRFICDNNLETELVKRFQQVHAGDHNTIIRVTAELQELILEGQVPADIAEQIMLSVEQLQPESLLAVRSSALAEDGEISFAGQYASELEVPCEEVIAAYKRVVAGKYCPRAVSYRLHHGLSDTDTAMAVLIVPMLEPSASGVVYTLDPRSQTSLGGGDFLGVYAVEGLAEGLVDGSRTPEQYQLSRNNNSISERQVPPQDRALLSASELMQLKKWGLQLENHFGCPQDVEWALDTKGLTILQSRRLQQKEDPPPAIVEKVDLNKLLYSDLHCAAAGISCGPVFFAPTGKTFRDIPSGSVVVTPTLRPALSQFLDRVVGVVAASGSRASHFASVARERGIPVLVGGDIELTAGQVVTIDAASGRIFSGCVNAVLQSGKLNANKEYSTKKYAELIARTTHLNLTDPDGKAFIPERCRSMHDIVRFCHEKSVREMFSLVGRKSRGLGKARKLDTELPLVMYLLDLDDPTPKKNKATVNLTELSSLPMLACWQGMSDSRISWDSSQHHVDWQEFDQVSGGIFSLDSQLLASYAIVSRDYLHLNIRFGYHFSVVDSICGKESSTNYINFRFKGGGAAHQQQLFRLSFIDLTLTAFGFETSSQGDMLDANFSRVPLPVTELALKRLGMLLAATRLMDVRLTSMQQATEEAEKFIAMVTATDQRAAEHPRQ